MVERLLPKQKVAGSNPVRRSKLLISKRKFVHHKKNNDELGSVEILSTMKCLEIYYYIRISISSVPNP